MRPYYGHPPACTCAACTGGRPSSRGGRNPSSRGDSGDGDWRVIDCPTCEGTGKIYAGWSNPDQGRVARCPRCLGKGKIRQRRSTPRSRREPPPERTGQTRRRTRRVEGPVKPSPDSPPERRQPPPSRPAQTSPARLGGGTRRRGSSTESARSQPRQPPTCTPSGSTPQADHRHGALQGQAGRHLVLHAGIGPVGGADVRRARLDRTFDRSPQLSPRWCLWRISPDIQSEIAEFLEGFRASEGGEPPPPAVAAPPSPDRYAGSAQPNSATAVRMGNGRHAWK